jgi:hypothetical protein
MRQRPRSSGSVAVGVRTFGGGGDGGDGGRARPSSVALTTPTTQQRRAVSVELAAEAAGAAWPPVAGPWVRSEYDDAFENCRPRQDVLVRQTAAKARVPRLGAAPAEFARRCTGRVCVCSGRARWRAVSSPSLSGAAAHPHCLPGAAIGAGFTGARAGGYGGHALELGRVRH